jgi:fructose-1,6-bisphosphatase I
MDIPSLTFLQKISKIKPNLINLLNAIHISCKVIQRQISKAGIVGLHGINNDINMNSSGDIQKKLDVISNEVMIDNLIHSQMCSILLSEENEEEIIVPEEYRGKFIVAFDPLDGSSNIDCNVCVGTIFAIYEQTEENWKNCIDGDKIICAGYCLYGPATELVITFERESGVLRFILDHSIGEFIYVGDINIPEHGKKIYSVNESNCENWEENIKKYVLLYKEKNTKYTQRYIGSMVADVHRTLLYGGMFMYPGDKKNIDGKLRVFYECFPMARIVEEAGGYAITTRNEPFRILDIKPKHIHERTPILLGSKDDVNKYIV